MHRAAAPARDPGRLAEQLRHDALGVGPAGQRVPVRAVGRDQVVGVAHRPHRADDRRLLADRQVQEAADLALGVHRARPLLEAADQQHRLEPLAALVRDHAGYVPSLKRRGNARVVTCLLAIHRGRTMKALVFGGPGQRSWDNVDDPGIQDPTDVIVKVETTTICGTDLHILKGDVPAVTEGRILGHEAVGTVVETGAAVSSLKKGDRVLVPAITSCGRCGPCKVGMAAHCEAVGGIGWIFGHLIDGVQAEYARVPYAETSVHLVPEGVSDQQVLFLADILPTGYEIGVQNGRVGPGDTIAVVGAGPGRPRGDDDRGDRRRRADHRGRHGRVTAQARRRVLRRHPHRPRRRERRAGDPRHHRRRRRRRRDGGRRRAGDLRPLHPHRPRGRHASPTSASTARRRRCTSRSSGSRTSRSPPAS